MTAGRRLATSAAPWREWSYAAAGGRRSPALVWEVTNAAGERCRLTGIQRSVLSYAASQAAAGRHRWTVRGCAEALGCAPSSVSRAIVRLRSLSLMGAYRPARGRSGGVLAWLPSPAAAARDRQERSVRWPTRAGLRRNVATLTSYAGYLSREGLRRSYAAAGGGRPPAARPPGGGAARAVAVRARGRPWPPPHVDEACPSTGHRERLPLRLRVAAPHGEALVFAGRGSRCGRGHAAAVVLAAAAPSSPSRPYRGGSGQGRPVTDARASIAAAVVPLLAEPHADRVRLDWLGWRRQEPHVPVLPAVVTTDRDGLAGAVGDLERRCRRELEVVAASRRPVLPAP